MNERVEPRLYPPTLSETFPAAAVSAVAPAIRDAIDTTIGDLIKDPDNARMAKAFLAAVSAGEVGGNGTIRTLYGGQEWAGDLSRFPPWPGVRLPDGSTTHAAGMLQFEPRTWDLISAYKGLTDFGARSQIINGWILAGRDFRLRSGGDLLVALARGDIASVAANLKLTWPGGCDSGLGARYSNSLLLFPGSSAPIPAPTPIPPTPGISSTIAGIQAHLDAATAGLTSLKAKIDALLSLR